MRHRSSLLLAGIASLTLLVACATEPGYYEPTYGTISPGYRSYDPGYRTYGPASTSAPQYAQYGVVEAIEYYPDGGSHPVGLGAVLGGVAGGILGHQIGSGSGNTAATIAGALGGAFVGDRLQKRRSDRDRYRVIVRLDNGARVTTDQVSEGEFRVGDRVRVVDNRIMRV